MFAKRIHASQWRLLLKMDVCSWHGYINTKLTLWTLMQTIIKSDICYPKEFMHFNAAYYSIANAEYKREERKREREREREMENISLTHTQQRNDVTVVLPLHNASYRVESPHDQCHIQMSNHWKQSLSNILKSSPQHPYW